MKALTRRQFVQTSLIATAVGAMGTSISTLAAWPVNAYKQESVDGVLNALFGHDKTQSTPDISMKIPEIAENGAVVPISIHTSLNNVESISILVDSNPNPLAARFKMGSSQKGEISTRIKIGKSSDVIAVVQSEGRLYAKKNHVKVTIGGCGG